MKNFSCTCCGDCCSGLMDIRINIYDIYKMAKHLKIQNSKDLFTKGYLKLLKGQNNLYTPKINFKTKPYPFCPFLINDVNENMELKGFCSLHPYIKPLVCILAPITKVYNTETGINEFGFIKPTESCPGELIGEHTPIEDILLPVKNEIEYENSFYDILNTIIDKKIDNYIDDLYYFNTDIPFLEILDSCRRHFEKA